MFIPAAPGVDAMFSISVALSLNISFSWEIESSSFSTVNLPAPPELWFSIKKYWYANYYAKMWSRKLTWALWWVHSYLHWVCPSKHKGSRFWQGCPPRWSCKRQKTSLGKSAPTLIWSIFQYRHLTSLVSSFLNLAAAGLTFGQFSSSWRVWPFSSTEVGGF